MQRIDVQNTWWQPPEARRFRVTPHSGYTYSIRNNRTDRCQYIFNSLITRSHHPCFSFNEYNAYSWLDLKPEVRTFQSQPAPVDYEIEGEIHSYTADAFVDYWDECRAAIEIKDEKAAFSASFSRKWPILKRAFAARGRTFTVITDRDLLAEPLRSNIQMIRREVNSRPPTDFVYRVTMAFENGGALPFGKLMEYSREPENWAHMHLLNLICWRRLTFDFETTCLTADTPIRLVHRGYSADFHPRSSDYDK